MTIFFTLYAPLYVTSWMRDALFSQAPVMFIPLFSYKLYPITLAFLVPGSYWINFAMIVLFYIQAAVAWYYLDIPHLNNIVLGSEPYITILFALVSFILLYFKYRDRKFIHDLIRIKVHMEAKQNISRVLLSLRDKANTPLQNQKLIIELLRKENSHSEDLINYLERSVKTLSDMSQLMSKLESETLSGSKEKLMSEEEIITYVNNVLNEKNIH
jgi:hypothetical protein